MSTKQHTYAARSSPDPALKDRVRTLASVFGRVWFQFDVSGTCKGKSGVGKGEQGPGGDCGGAGCRCRARDKGTFTFGMPSPPSLERFELMQACREMISANEEASFSVPSMLMAAR
ncbi:hypothetical protein BV22DRAFT_607050 [Leucogyrophana mollusca]|uniref:Uncharacterized protein n=1 Tax=Leucogyrophana mollusca TaxID=85980 RepID=A0ACB8BCX7_9AGAM|nr:hypothetical protein BV22DRAFT_607050 [Leucogyrophana mollusca]